MEYNLKAVCNLKPFYKLVFNYDTEFCGIFEKRGDCLVMDKSSVAVGYKTEDGRNACRHKKNDSLIWHTHPYSAHSYPSHEDIFKVLKYREKPEKYVRKSIIFTRWGVWQISFDGYRKLDWEKEKEKVKELEKIIYENTEEGKVNSLNDHQLKYIRIYQYKLEDKYIGLNIEFDRWKDLYNEVLFI
jgi:hypothetical protein